MGAYECVFGCMLESVRERKCPFGVLNKKLVPLKGCHTIFYHHDDITIKIKSQ